MRVTSKMTPEVFLAIFGCVSAAIALVKYLVTKLSESNKDVVKAHAQHLLTFQKEIKEVRQNYYYTISKIESVKAQMISVQRGASDNNSQLKTFIELTQKYISESERRIKNVEELMGKIIKVGK